jgi:hypothetical protein
MDRAGAQPKQGRSRLRDEDALPRLRRCLRRRCRCAQALPSPVIATTHVSRPLCCNRIKPRVLSASAERGSSVRATYLNGIPPVSANTSRMNSLLVAQLRHRRGSESFGRVAAFIEVAERSASEQREPASALVLGTVVQHVAPLAQRFQVRGPVIGRVVIKVRAG